MDGKYSDSLIYKRHSIRKFTGEPVSNEQLDHILRATMAAPSAHNSQAWTFIIVDDRASLDAIADFHPYAKMMREASMAIVVCVVKEVADANVFYQQDMGAAVQNALLAATECGLGSCWCGVHPKRELEKKFTELCRIPDEAFPFAVIALGVPATSSAPSTRYEERRVHRNVW